LRTGTTGSFWSIGGGAGADIGISQELEQRQRRSLGGGGASGSLSAGYSQLFGNASLGKKASHLMEAALAWASGVFRLGISGTLSGTRLYGCKVRGDEGWKIPCSGLSIGLIPFVGTMFFLNRTPIGPEVENKQPYLGCYGFYSKPVLKIDDSAVTGIGRANRPS
jgi:hypothetical protein